jgi:two-component system chemotaxis response regulator CheY
MDGLIIDDNRSTADALHKMLGTLGVSARVAYGSSAAMAILRSFIPGFIFLDINMPGVDGFEILTYLKREPRLTKVPVIIITSDDQAETRQRVLQGGALGVLIKPATLTMLEDALKAIGALK